MKLVLKLHDHITVSQADKIIDELKAYGEVAIEPEAASEPEVVSPYAARRRVLMGLGFNPL